MRRVCLVSVPCGCVSDRESEKVENDSKQSRLKKNSQVGGEVDRMVGLGRR